jgi:ribosomal protein L24E
MHKLPFKTKIVTVESENEIYWFKREKCARFSGNVKRKKGVVI